MIRIAQYKGKSLTSKLIKFVTWGKYSHTAIMLEDDLIVEAWQGSNSVRIIKSLSDGHKPGTEVDIYSVRMGKNQEKIFRKFVLDQVGVPYDYWGIHGFLWRKNRQNPNNWFCSELFAGGCKAARVLLLNNKEPHQISPSDASRSTRAKYIKSVTTE